MPFNGSGTFTIVNTFVPNTTILSAAVNQNFSDIATGLSNCLTRDGQAGMTQPLKAVSGTVSAPGITFNADATAGIYLSTTGIVGLVAKSLGILINSSILQVASAAVQVGGSGFAIGDTLTTTGGTAINQAVLTVATLSGSAVATVSVTYPGNFSVMPTNPVTVTTDGLGTGCALNLTPTTQYLRSVATDESGNPVWQRLGASSFVSGLMAYANGKDFVTGIGAANVAAAIGLSAPPPGSSFKNLAIKVTTNTALTATADFVVTTNGSAFLTTPLSSTINMATTGANALDTGSIAANTSYAVWAIAKPDGTTAGLASTSFTSPTLPSGYTYFSRIGAVRTAPGSAQLRGTWQKGRRVQYVLGLAQTTGSLPVLTNGAQGSVSVPTWVTEGVGGHIPSTASEIIIVLSNNDIANGAMVAPNNSYGALTSLTNAPPVAVTNTAGLGTVSASLLLESANIYYASSSASAQLYVLGWVDNL